MADLSQYSRHQFVEESTNNSWSNMLRYVPEGARVLDVGCSTGNFGEALRAIKHCSVVGVDLSEADIEIARTKISEAYVLDITAPGAAEKLGKFDVVVFADVIEHLPDPRATLRSVLDLLSEGGCIIYSIPNMGHISVRLDLLEGRFPYAELGLLDRTHLHYYDRYEVADVFARSGYRIVSEHPTVSDFSESLVTARLEILGITADERFFGLLAHTDSHVYQYVGMAVPAGSAPVAPPPPREYMTPPDELLQHANRVQAHADRIEAELVDARARVDYIDRHPIRSALGAVRARFRRVVR